MLAMTMGKVAAAAVQPQRTLPSLSSLPQVRPSLALPVPALALPSSQPLQGLG
jgi:hypothetical protein